MTGKDVVTSSAETKKVLNVGGNTKIIPIPHCFDGWRHDLLDIDPRGNPDVLCDARELWRLPIRQYDAIYCSHNLEHFHRHEVNNVLKGFRLVLKKDGFVYIRVPDIHAVACAMVEDGLDIDSVLYVAACGPILVRDVLYGYHVEIEQSGNDFFSHKTGFTEVSLTNILKANQFTDIHTWCGKLEVSALGFISPADTDRVSGLIASLQDWCGYPNAE